MNQTRLNGLRLSFATLGVSALALAGSFIFVEVLAAWRGRDETPRLAVDSLVKALRTHHRQTGRFPTDFRELEARVWKHKQPPDFGADGRSLSVANYFYLYYPVSAGEVAIWIIPIGPRREEGSTHFLLLRPDSLRHWKGAPLSLEEIKNLPSIPQYRQMAILGMTEQAPIGLTRRR